jgi:DNA-binding MarR family transcriptional regulator
MSETKKSISVGEICYKLNKSAMLYKRIMSKHLDRMNITYSQLMVLRVINQNPGISAKEILFLMDTDKATLSGVLSRLERNNYIYTQKNEQDGRIKNLYVSTGSEFICSEVNIIEIACLQDLTEGIDPEKTQIFIDVLNQFIDNQLKELEK